MIVSLAGQGVALFHLDKLLDDMHFNDGTLVVIPCNSPEQPPITFGVFIQRPTFSLSASELRSMCSDRLRPCTTTHMAVV